MMRWIEYSPFLHEARATLPDGHDVYVGYVAVWAGSDDWCGYVGINFTPVGVGPLPAMRRTVEEHMREILEYSKRRVNSAS
jgi:hypothetical protein